MQVCSKHFKPEDYIPTRGLGLKPNLKKTSVPSLNLPVRSCEKILSSPVKIRNEARTNRVKNRSLLRNNLPKQAEENRVPSSEDGSSVNDLHSAAGTLDNEDWVDMELNPNDEIKFKDVGIQVDLEDGLSGFVANILSNDKKLFSATGLHSVKLLNTLTTCFEKIAPDSRNKKFSICTRNRILLTMFKIKLAISFSALAVLFDLTIQSCSNYFYDTVGILSKILKSVIFWPKKEDVLKNMPKCFSNFKCTRVVLDCYEIPIEKAKCITCRIRSYSHYKKNFTAKLAMNVTPSGLICHSCAAFGGRASDKVITNQSGIYKLCDPADGIMVDKGYDIDEECRDNLLVLIRPPFLKQKKRFSKAESVQCAKIARARVHVERVIQRVREYHILKFKITKNILPHIDDIATIVCGLVNLGKPVIANDKF